MTRNLHIPFDFDRVEAVRRLVVLMPDNKASREAMALSVAVRLWSDWARGGVAWRPFSEPWAEDPLVAVIEENCGWMGDRGKLVEICLKANLIAIEKRGALDGFVLPGFWERNEHLSPEHRTIQQRGGRMKAAMSKMKNVEDLASRQVTLFGQMEIAFGEATPEQIEKATALIMRMDLACDRPQRRTEDFKRIMGQAVTVVRTHIPEDVDRVLKYLIKHASDSSIVNDPDYVISNFDDYLNKTKQLVSSPL